MALAEFESATLVLDEDVLESLTDCSVRILGKLINVDCVNQRGSIEIIGKKKDGSKIKQKGNYLTIDLSLISQVQLQAGSFYHFIGEIRKQKIASVNDTGNNINNFILMFEIRIARNANDVNTHLYAACAKQLLKSIN